MLMTTSKVQICTVYPYNNIINPDYALKSDQMHGEYLKSF